MYASFSRARDGEGGSEDKANGARKSDDNASEIHIATANAFRE